MLKLPNVQIRFYDHWSALNEFDFNFDAPGPRIKVWGTQEVCAFYHEAKVKQPYDDGKVSCWLGFYMIDFIVSCNSFT